MIVKGGIRWVTGLRLLHTSRILQAVDKATLSKLRKKTGFPFVNCKKALERFEGDLPQAEQWLRDEAQKEGWAKATKLQGRPMSQGLVGVVVDHLTAAMVEVNCETDFVAKNPKFQSLVSRTAALCLQNGKDSQSSKLVLDKVAVNALGTKEGGTVADMVALEVGSIGENMAVRRAFLLQAQPGDHIGTYVHSAGPHIVKDNRCTMGRYGALVIFRQPVAPEDGQIPTAELGRQLGQHIVGMNPQRVGSMQEEVEEVEVKEKEEVEGKDKEEEQEKVEGKEEEVKKIKEEDNSMVKQEFLLEPSLTVGEFLEQNGAEVLDFARFQCGEDLGEE